jgi:hypothetical protein
VNASEYDAADQGKSENDGGERYRARERLACARLGW